jgi:hypothetical protein
MTNETWQTVSQAAVALGIILTGLGGWGAYVFSQRVATEKEARTASSGRLTPPKRTVVLSAADSVWPLLEIGESGSMFRYTGPRSGNLFDLGADTRLRIIREDDQVKISVVIRDETGQIIAELIDNQWNVNPHNSYDRNYKSDALEVRDPSGDIVLQVRLLPDRIRFQASCTRRTAIASPS